MPFDRRNYPNSMKNLDKEVRDKAIDIINAMLKEGYDEDNAIPIAICPIQGLGKWCKQCRT